MRLNPALDDDLSHQSLGPKRHAAISIAGSVAHRGSYIEDIEGSGVSLLFPMKD